MIYDIPKHINNLLYNHECVIVSGLGAFIIHEEDTIIDEKKNLFTPLKKIISFNPEIKKNDGLLANYISEIENISFEEACIKIASFVNEIVIKINNGETFHLETIGVLQLNNSGYIVFKKEDELNFNSHSFGLESFYFPQIKKKSNIIKTQYISGVLVLLILATFSFYLNKNMYNNYNPLNTASFNLNIKSNSKYNETAGLYKINVSQVDYDLYKINGTDYHLSTKRCFKMGESINAQLKIFNHGKTRKKNICFLNEKGLEYSDCYKVINVYRQIPTSNNNLIIIDKKGKMRNAILVFEETEIDYNYLIQNNLVIDDNEEKDDIASRFQEAVKTLTENSDISLENEIENERERQKIEKIKLQKQEEAERIRIQKEVDERIRLQKEEAERIRLQKEEAERIRIEKEVDERIRLQKEETERIRLQKEETEKILTHKKEKNVFIIVGCFSSEKNAKNLVFQLNKKGFKDASIVGRSKNRKLFRVACSRYLTEKEANKNLKNLKKEFQGAWVFNKK